MNLFEKLSSDLVNDSVFLHDFAKLIQTRLIQKIAFDDSAWDGSASNWDTAEAYCSDCLIDLNEGDGPKTKDKCKLPYRKSGSSKPNLGALRAIASGARGLAATSAPAVAKAAAARKVASWWQAAFDKPAPDGIQRLASGSKSYSAFFKDADGQWWFWGIYSNKFEDRQEEIIPEEGHKEYIEWLNESGFKPMITVLHQPRMPDGFWEEVFRLYEDSPEILNKIVGNVYKNFGIARADRVIYLNGFASVVGKVLPGKEAVAERLSTQTDLGMSHGFIVKNSSAKILAKYRSFEMSTLKSTRAANLFTTSALALQKENSEVAKTLSPEDRKFLVTAFGEDAVKTFESDTGENEKILEGLLAFKALTEDGPQEKATPAPEPSEADKAKMPMDDMEDEEEDEEDDEKKKDADPEVVKQVLEVLNISELQKVLTDSAQTMQSLLKEVSDLKAEVAELRAVAKDVKELKKSDDEKIAFAISPINWKATGYSASQDKGNGVGNEQERADLNKAAPTGAGPDPNSFFGAILAPMLKGGQ